MPSLITLFGLAGLVLAFLLLWWIVRGRRRDRSLRRLLDLADEMESLLDLSQVRMRALQGVVGRVPRDIAAVAQASIDSTLPVREAKRDLLQHRLWIKHHGQAARQSELDAACAALGRARDRLAGELAALDRAGEALAEATEASEQAAQREPAALRRPENRP
ncbi:hypothetical protein [Arenimonas caeni]|jgi:hypothetical protein|uniref:Uncharacterized protein n=1 Tax=Arenimonas caeni TaxID=2058085 RepID=A0A2P6M788_9GAMM|nr:hypothetical protein [Arenimonas caeni]MDY0021308.1 hypothetical protein [Arenimonas caeni]PRH81861.1 hypothetical protein C6N40_10765 [Arenimonas caeni]